MRLAGLVGLVAILAGGCAAAAPSSAPTPSAALPTPTAIATPTPSPASTTAPTPVASPSGPVTPITLATCPAPTTDRLCLGPDAGTLSASAMKGGHLVVTLTATNNRTVASGPITLMFFELEPGPWPFGAGTCEACSHVGKTGGFEWPALVPGETRTLTVSLPVTGTDSSYIVFGGLWDTTLAAVNQAGSLDPDLAGWKIALSVTK